MGWPGDLATLADVSAISRISKEKIAHSRMGCARRARARAYSGGVDSSFLAFAAHRALGDGRARR
jgi:PP-loop superfamily ATP-utilizing enzyme